MFLIVPKHNYPHYGFSGICYTCCISFFERIKLAQKTSSDIKQSDLQFMKIEDFGTGQLQLPDIGSRPKSIFTKYSVLIDSPFNTDHS